MSESILEIFGRLVSTGDTYLFLLPIYGGLLITERLVHAVYERERVWNNGDTAANIFLTGVFLLLNMTIGHLLPLGLMAWIHHHAHLLVLPSSVLGWAAAFILYDLAWYVDHRIAHRTGFFWAMHHVHHSSPEYNMTVASRGFILDMTLFSRPTFYLLPILGITPYHFMVVSIASNIWGIAQHTRMVGKLGWLDWFFATPSNHRVHHGSNPKYLDRNYGEVWIIWDRLFGTYKAEEEEPTYGVTDPINTNNPVRIETAGLQWLWAKMRRAHHFQDALRCLWMPPEWTLPPSLPEGSDKGSAQA